MHEPKRVERNVSAPRFAPASEHSGGASVTDTAISEWSVGSEASGSGTTATSVGPSIISDESSEYDSDATIVDANKEKFSNATDYFKKSLRGSGKANETTQTGQSLSELQRGRRPGVREFDFSDKDLSTRKPRNRK